MTWTDLYLAYIVIGLFVFALRNSWDLLVELRLAIGARISRSDEDHEPETTSR